LNEWLTYTDIAKLSGLKYDTIYRHRKRSTLPEPDLQIGNKPLWSKSTIDTWMTKRESKENEHGKQV